MVAGCSTPFTLDQLRAFVTVVEEGSFSAAARKLHRVQSAVSTAMANLESQLGVPFGTARPKSLRSPRRAGRVGRGRRVLGEVDGLRALTARMDRGLEASVSLCVDALFPLGALVAAVLPTSRASSPRSTCGSIRK